MSAALSLASRGQAVATTDAVRQVVTVAVILRCSSSSTDNTTTRCTLHDPPEALPPTRTNHLGIDSCYARASRSSALPAAQLRCKLDRACVKLAVMAGTLCTVATIEISCRHAATPRPADSYPVQIELDGATQVLTVSSHWTERDVTAALEAKTGRSLRGRYLLAPGGKALHRGKTARTLGAVGVRKDSVLEVRHRRRGAGCAGSKVAPAEKELQEEKAAERAGAEAAPAGAAEEEQKVVALDEAPAATAPSPAPTAAPVPAAAPAPAAAPVSEPASGQAAEGGAAEAEKGGAGSGPARPTVGDCVEVVSGDHSGRCGTIVEDYGEEDDEPYKVQLLGVKTSWLRKSEVRKIDPAEMERRQAEERVKTEQELQEATQGTDIPTLDKALEQAKEVGE